MIARSLQLVLGLSAALLLSACERPPMQSTQQGYRGTGMVDIQNPRILAAKQAAVPAVPVLPPAPADSEGPKAKDIYQNVQVLGDLSVADFTRHMLAITQWVAPEQGCTYCHGENLAEDSKYTKVVARRMLQMNRSINGNWTQHVAQTGVTCYTCHRGKPVPDNVWFTALPNERAKAGSMLGDDAGQNKAEPSIALASLPYDPWTSYLLGGKDGSEQIRVQPLTALPTGSRASIKQAEFTYSLMNHMSQSLGVNCTFCHNTQSFLTWNDKRVTAYHGINMAREINNTYVVPLTKTFPANRLGPGGDVAKVFCATCHQGVNKPLGGLAMAKDWAGLTMVKATAVVEAPLPPPVAESRRAVLYFGVGSPSLGADQARGLVELIDTLTKQATATATISGFHSASGTLAQNQELAKQRAINVRDALMSAGIDEKRIRLAKPVQTEANVAGEDASARRVEVTVRR
jgi:photosynthetic reaction center cytochrome c subunit